MEGCGFIKGKQAPQGNPAVRYSDAELGQQLRSLKSTAAAARIAARVSVPLGFIVLAYFGVHEMWAPLLATVAVSAVILFGGMAVHTSTQRKMKALLGENITYAILSETFEIDEYSPKTGIPLALIREARLVEGFSDYDGSDYFRGRYKGVSLQFSDLHLTRTETDTDSDGAKTTETVTVFRGQWMTCEFGKQLAAKVYILENSEKFGGGYHKQKSSLETESVAFNEQFRIYSDDGHSAFLLLTPHFMERLVRTDKLVNGRSAFCFADGKVHMALYTGADLFELHNADLSQLDALRDQFRANIKYMTDILDELLSNDQLFQKD